MRYPQFKPSSNLEIENYKKPRCNIFQNISFSAAEEQNENLINGSQVFDQNADFKKQNRADSEDIRLLTSGYRKGSEFLYDRKGSIGIFA